MRLEMKAPMVEALRPFLAVIGARYRMLLQYRAAAFAGFGTQLFWGAIKLMVLAAFYAVASAEPPMSMTQIVAYVWLGQALFALLPWNVDPEIAEKMRTGSVAYELLRPLDLYAFWFARTLAFKTASATLRMIPMVLTCVFVLPLLGLGAWALPPPASQASFLMFLMAIGATVLLTTAITMILHLALFWTLSGRGFNAIMYGLVGFFSGLIVPLPLLPEWLQGVLYWQPFRGLADVPFRIYSGSIPAAEAGFEILLQLGWTAVMVGLGYAVYWYARGRLVVQGG
jgi:ABC-2 type transport system permease protein